MIQVLHEIFDTIEDFLRSYFDKLLLTAIFVFLMGIVVNYDTSPTGTLAGQMAGTVLGAIVMLITGLKKNGEAPKPEPSPAKPEPPKPDGTTGA